MKCPTCGIEVTFIKVTVGKVPYCNDPQKGDEIFGMCPQTTWVRREGDCDQGFWLNLATGELKESKL